MTKRVAPGSITSASGLPSSSLAGSNAVTYDGHGFETNDPLTVRAVDGGSLSAPLVAGTTYYARRLTNATFELAAALDGSAIDLTTDAVSMVVMREPDFDYWIEFYSRWADSKLPGHLVPFTTIPRLVEGLVADLVAKRMFNVCGQASETLKEMEIASATQLATFATGMPIRDVASTASANLAITGSGTASDPRGWGDPARLP